MAWLQVRNNNELNEGLGENFKEITGDIEILWLQNRNNISKPVGDPKRKSGKEANSDRNISVPNIGPAAPQGNRNSGQDTGVLNIGWSE